MDTGPGADPDRLTLYEEVMEQWALNDCRAVTNSPGDDAMKGLFQRWRATRSKPVPVTNTVPRRRWTALGLCSSAGGTLKDRRLSSRSS
ncbi:hypothetical protein PR003_g13489 [Phytophthora rubi]|uniref:Uncharacterized protein n=1 Tax=Phytophthora rubi TaxID=129364 RepID=A0A6A4F6H4_9STRA|nr:hypothetical protein PR002_g15001 [Phytophthora rubi]KAE9334514.1 hypothetical protein PR003_g13489 [Phytophthora rubi]